MKRRERLETASHRLLDLAGRPVQPGLVERAAQASAATALTPRLNQSVGEIRRSRRSKMNGAARATSGSVWFQGQKKEGFAAGSPGAAMLLGTKT